MNVAGTGMRAVVATRPVDFHKGHGGLAAVVEHELGLDPYSAVAVVFRPKRSRRIDAAWGRSLRAERQSGDFIEHPVAGYGCAFAHDVPGAARTGRSGQPSPSGSLPLFRLATMAVMMPPSTAPPRNATAAAPPALADADRA